ncbi:CocE/NonD family hydrolase [Streptomyces sp. NPDC005356]|uniref:CocE/NonD family hydrolase n=1 Tax=Streptomyces sp. NPDC005356 TaxID=3157167 RepID=UPI0033AFF9E2
MNAGRHDEVDLPTNQVGDWYDIFRQGRLDNFTAMRRAGRPATLAMGPWTHTNWRHVVGDANFGFGTNYDFMGRRGRVHDMQFDCVGHRLSRTRAARCCSSVWGPTSGVRSRNGPSHGR